MKPENIYSKIPEGLPEELFEEILSGGNFKLVGAVGLWMDQSHRKFLGRLNFD